MNDIEALLKATIQTKVIEAFNSAPEVVEKLVAAALSKEVTEHGGRPSYNDKKMPFMEWLVGEEIRKAVQACVHEYVEGHKAEIAERVQAAMVEADFMRPLSEQVASVLGETYRWSVDLNIKEKDKV